MRRKFIAGNWKMHKTTAEAGEFAENLKGTLKDRLSKGEGDGKTGLPENMDIAICAPFTQLDTLVKAFEEFGDSSDISLTGSVRGTDPGAASNNRNMFIGAQNVYFEDRGAFTGEISMPMLEEIGVDFVIIGHSERRQYFGDTDETINKKLKRSLQSSRIKPILCVGEALNVREADGENSFVESQVVAAFEGIDKSLAGKVVIAYEPIWAIGTGKTASSQQAQDMCRVIRNKIADLYGRDLAMSQYILYGGSVKPGNAKEILSMEDIDGALVGGASLKVEDFLGICFAYEK